MENIEKEKNKEKFSYSKTEIFAQCPYKYKLIYVDKHFINQPGIATDFGTLIHFIEETMANTIKSGNQINYHTMIDLLYKGYKDDKTEVKGVDKLIEDYPVEFYTPDKNGRTYAEKVETYIDSGICRLEDYLATNPTLEIVAAEEPFEVEFRNYIFHGFIDRIFRDTVTGEYIIEDIKTYSAPLKADKLTTPLQFVIYSMAWKSKFPDAKIKCAYELPLCYCKQDAGTKGFVERGIKKLNELLDEIEEDSKSQEFAPNPSPLCHWCVFCKTYPNQPEEAKNLCPYYSHWTRENKDFSVENEWMGKENHEAILEAFINSYGLQPEIKVTKTEPDNVRRFLLRR